MKNLYNITHFRVYFQMLMKMCSKCYLVKQNFGCMHFQMGKVDVAKRTVSKYAHLKCT